jgi:GNAT superfamily N-acetyltransferase
MRETLGMAPLTIAYLSDHPEAVPTLAAWFAREWGDGSPATTQAAIAERLATKAGPPELPITLVALLESEPVATATLKFREIDWAPEADYWLGSVYVRDDLRGRGFGRAIIAAAQAAAADAGHAPLHLYSPAKAALYRRLGWEPVGETVANGKQATVLRQACLTSAST